MVTILMIFGAVLAVLVAGLFCGGRYGPVDADVSLVERFCMEREVEERLAELAPGVMLLAERENALRSFAPDVGVLREPLLLEFWSDFARVSCLLEEDPLSAAAELRLLEPDLRECLRMVGESRGMSSERLVVEGGETNG